MAWYIFCLLRLLLALEEDNSSMHCEHEELTSVLPKVYNIFFIKPILGVDPLLEWPALVTQAVTCLKTNVQFLFKVRLVHLSTACRVSGH